ncbi:gluconate:H+ symporter [Dellaglioa algida]|uniref:H+ gluconate symporter related permease n=2 Tax=Dellaglioa algida TaxID=105612 RepID=A0A0R1HJX0_9LACO|nr:gluconate:H+ symporter [Dellaglioa algida]KRK46667.1 H+ gluconate symporter related permease [Dellaglioa algida DSM 15638]MDK1716466.1 gluconate:H+ symporter [Dellaglioa algida]MDK1718111.1 gluconate:H+ symporter [Dellaglioa algida]MDK1720041.1 gluconate:H+ symporter [Dellaglioa algida]MDK1721408.1 gluconate:H+ symporter [Dellaglioa algida]
MPLLIVFIGILFLLLLIIKFKLNTFVSLIITSFVVAIGLGMPLDKITTSIENGIGSQLGHLSLVFGFGAMLGKLVADSGGAYRIATTLINRFGRKWIQLAVVLASFIIGIALFFEVGIVLLIPIIFAIATELGISILYLGIPMAAALSVTHGFLPPHPAPTAIASALNANVGMVLIYGLILAIPVTLIAGPLFAVVAQKYIPSAFKQKGNLSALGTQKEFKLEDTPSFGMSTLTSLFPVIIMAISTIYDMVVNKGIRPKNPNSVDSFFMFIGAPGVAMLLSLLFAIYSMGFARKIPVKDIMSSLEVAVKQIAMLLLIIGGGGAFKQVLVDGGVANVISKMFESSSLSPLFLGWLIAALLRVSLGSATVAALTAAGLVSGLMAGTGVDPALMVIAIGSGSLIASHVNDAGFWMIKEYFDLTVKETLATWTVLETVVSVSGLGGVMIINLFV